MAANLRRREWLLLGATGAGALLAGCGFRLRGVFQFPFQSIHIVGSANSATVNLLKRMLSTKVRVTEAATDADAVLTVLVDSAERIVSAFSASAQVREVELRQLFDFSLSGANGAVLIDNAQIRLNRFVSYNESQATAKEAELDLLQRDMRSDVVQQVQRRLAAVKPASP